MSKPPKLASVLVLVSLILSACAPGTPAGIIVDTPTSSPTVPIPTATPTPIPDLIGVPIENIQGISIRVASAFLGGSKTAFNNLLAKFNTVNEWGFIVYLDEYDSYNALFDEVSSSLNTTDQPELVVTFPEQVLTWDQQSAVTSLDPYLHDPRYGFTRDEMDDFQPIFWEMAGGQDDPKLSLPAEISSPFLFYNRTWAQELGFTEIPSTFAQFREQACTATQSYLDDDDPRNDGYGGWVVNTSPLSILSWIHAFGGSVLDSGELLFTTNPNEAALQSIKTLYDDHCAFISTERNQYSTFANRSALFITADLAEISNQETIMSYAGNSDVWSIIPFPGDHPGLVAEGPAYSILSSSPEKQFASWLFIHWLLSTGNQVSWVTTTGLFPMQTSILASLDGYRSTHPLWDQAIGYMDDLTTQPVLQDWRQGKLVLGDAAAFIFRTNQETSQVKSILEQMDATIQDLDNQ